VEAEDARLEAYRRLSHITTLEEMRDLREEWLDRYGALPAAAQGLLDLGELRVRCLGLGIRSLQILPAKVGIRSHPLLKASPVSLSMSQQMRLRRRFGSGGFNDETKELKIELTASQASATGVLAVLEELFETAN
jgi:transcription-repair coupling factor (superfamily II helicase)